ncbi:hypothetical protein [Sphingobacterium faecium]|uniref:hypothetical protein n=1 Tax=Sphingobacterium faecium TaxID=34087 RepID=UPI002478F88B|nr:hypothetical protein [Sphingobacterium faecium]WGQ14520.1 hypothetical protein QG727_21160 [Sphingobacterium faecium]
MDETFPVSMIEWKKSYQSGLDELLTNSYDLILLDMSMHIYEESNSEGGGNFETYAGKMLLEEIELYNIITKVVVVTGYDVYGDGTTLGSLKDELRRNHGEYYLGTVYFVSKEENWKKELYSLITTSFNSI